MEERARRRVKVDLDDLAFAFEFDAPETGQYLDLETGEVVAVEYAHGRAAERIYEEIDSDDPAAFAVELQRREMPQWEREAILQADLVEEGLGTRFMRISHLPSGDAYADMESFIETIGDQRLRNKLWSAIRGRGAFRRFKDVLEDHPLQRELWFAFQAGQMRKRVLEWLHDENIEPVTGEE